MKFVSLAEVKNQLSAYVHQCEDGETVIITKNGKPSVALINIKDETDLESLILANSKQFQKIIEESRKSYQHGEGISHAQFWEEMEGEKS